MLVTLTPAKNDDVERAAILTEDIARLEQIKGGTVVVFKNNYRPMTVKESFNEIISLVQAQRLLLRVRNGMLVSVRCTEHITKEEFLDDVRTDGEELNKDWEKKSVEYPHLVY